MITEEYIRQQLSPWLKKNLANIHEIFIHPSEPKYIQDMAKAIGCEPVFEVVRDEINSYVCNIDNWEGGFWTGEWGGEQMTPDHKMNTVQRECNDSRCAELFIKDDDEWDSYPGYLDEDLFNELKANNQLLDVKLRDYMLKDKESDTFRLSVFTDPTDTKIVSWRLNVD